MKRSLERKSIMAQEIEEDYNVKISGLKLRRMTEEEM